MDAGLWFLSLYNDGDAARTLSFTATPHGQSPSPTRRLTSATHTLRSGTSWVGSGP